MTPETKRLLIIVIGIVLIASMVTGYFPELVGLVKDTYEAFRSILPGVKA